MKIIIDESTPQNLRLLIRGDHSIVTTWYQGWSGLKNGALLDAIDQAGFDLMISSDQELKYQQNLAKRTFSLIVLSTNDWSLIKMHVDLINAAIDTLTARSYKWIEIPEDLFPGGSSSPSD